MKTSHNGPSSQSILTCINWYATGGSSRWGEAPSPETPSSRGVRLRLVPGETHELEEEHKLLFVLQSYIYIYVYVIYRYMCIYICIYIHFPAQDLPFQLHTHTHTSTNKSSQAWQVKSLVFLKSDKLTLVDPRFPGGLAKKIQEILDQYIQDPKFWVVGPRCMGKRIWRFLLIQQLRLAVVRLSWAVFRHAGVWPKAIV